MGGENASWLMRASHRFTDAGTAQSRISRGNDHVGTGIVRRDSARVRYSHVPKVAMIRPDSASKWSVPGRGRSPCEYLLTKSKCCCSSMLLKKGNAAAKITTRAAAKSAAIETTVRA